MEPPSHTHRFENGLTLVHQELAYLPSVSLDLLLPVGAVNDPEGAVGSTAVLVEWLERGAGERSAKALSDAFDAMGVRRGSGAGVESTAFNASLLAETLPQTLALYADIVQRPQLEDATFENAKRVILEDLASLEDNPSQRLMLALMRRYFASAQGRSSYGEAADVRALTAPALRADFAKRFSPQGAILSLAGGISWEAAKDLVGEHFGAWQGEGMANTEVVVQGAGAQHLQAATAQTQIGLAYAGVAPQDPNWYHNALAVAVLSKGMGSRLFREVREKRGLVYSVSASNRALKNYGYTVAYAGTTPQRAAETLAVLSEELRALRAGVSAEELARARTGLLSSLIMENESSGGVAGALARNTLLFGAPRSLSEVKAALEAVSLTALNDFLAARPEPEFTVVTLGPEVLEPAAYGAAGGQDGN